MIPKKFYLTISHDEEGVVPQLLEKFCCSAVLARGSFIHLHHAEQQWKTSFSRLLAGLQA
jgi:hypothetical protein